MSEPIDAPPPIPALALGYYASPDVRRRPVMLSIIAWVGIVWGGISMLRLVSFGLMLFIQYFAPGLLPQHGGSPGIQSSLNFFEYSTITGLIAGIAGGFLLIGSILALRRRRQGRKLLIAYSIFFIIYSVGTGIEQIAFVIPSQNSIPFHTTFVTAAHGNVYITDINVPPHSMRYLLIQCVVITSIQIFVASLILFYLLRPSLKAFFNTPTSPTENNSSNTAIS